MKAMLVCNVMSVFPQQFSTRTLPSCHLHNDISFIATLVKEQSLKQAFISPTDVEVNIGVLIISALAASATGQRKMWKI
jgi:hypothetical protein